MFHMVNQDFSLSLCLVQEERPIFKNFGYVLETSNLGYMLVSTLRSYRKNFKDSLQVFFFCNCALSKSEELR